MKTCPVCNVQMPDAQSHCPACGTDYVQAIVNDITGGADSDASLVLAGLEEGLGRLDSVPLPTIGETACKMIPVLCGGAMIFFVVAGIVAQANIFYILAAILLIPLLISLFARMRGKAQLSSGEVLIQATAKIFAEDAASVRERFAKQPDVTEQLDAMQQRLDEALAKQKAGHRRNCRKVTMIAVIVLVICAAAVATLAIHKHGIRKAAAEYAMLPEWTKLQDRYFEMDPSDEAGGKDMRLRVVEAMVDADKGAEAEAFFFMHSQGKMGDVDCAMAIARYYKAENNADALAAFKGKVKLRYDSDTRKVKSLK